MLVPIILNFIITLSRISYMTIAKANFQNNHDRPILNKYVVVVVSFLFIVSVLISEVLYDFTSYKEAVQQKEFTLELTIRQ